MLLWILTDMIIIYASLAELRIFKYIKTHMNFVFFFVFIFKKKKTGTIGDQILVADNKKYRQHLRPNLVADTHNQRPSLVTEKGISYQFWSLILIFRDHKK